MGDVVRPNFGVQIGGVTVPLVGLWGLSESGKSTVADILDAQYGFARFSMGRLIGGVVAMGEGLRTEPLIDEDTYDLFKQSIPGYHQKLVTYGNAMRELFDGDIWARAAADQIQQVRWQGHPVVWENVRTEADYNLVRSLGGRMVEIERPRTRAFSPLDLVLADRIKFPMAYKLANAGTVDVLADRVNDMLEELYPDDGPGSTDDHGGTPRSS